MRNIKEISNYLLREIAVYENKKRMLEFENGISPKKNEKNQDEIKNIDNNNDEEEAEESPNTKPLII